MATIDAGTTRGDPWDMGHGASVPLPQWTEYQETEGGGRDPLGLDRVPQRFLDYTLPGITSQTQRARYYSAYSWMVGDVRAAVPRGDGRIFTSAFQRREAAFALACTAHHSGDGTRVGVAGYRRASRKWNEGGKVCEINFPVMKATLGGLGQYYRAPMERSGLLARDEQGLHVTELGRRVAGAFGKAVAVTSIARKGLLADDAVARGALEDFGKTVCLCRLAEFPEERNLLRDVFFRSGEGWQLQHDSLIWLLDVASQAGLKKSRSELSLASLALEWVAYDGAFPDGRPYAPPEALAYVIDDWRVFQANVFFGYFLEELAAVAADVLMGHSEGLTIGEITQVLAKKSRGSEPLTERLASLRRTSRTQHDVVEDLAADHSPPERAALALEGLLLCYLRHEAESGNAWRAFEVYGQSEVWAGTLRALVPPPDASDLRVDDWLGSVLDSLVLGQHQRVLYEKGRMESRVFAATDGRWSAEQRVRPTRAGSRLGPCVSILVDLGLLRGSPTGTETLTPEGRAWLERWRGKQHVA